MKKITVVLCTVFMMTGVFAETLGDGIGVPDLSWTSEGDEGPWHYSSNEGYGGGACVISGGGGGGTATSWLRATVNGPCRISFRYLVQTYTGAYTVKSDDSVLYTWTGITGTGAQWQSAQYDIPSGSHVLEFSYTHKGVGYANQFNGVKICELAIQGTGNAGGTLYVSPDGNDSNDGTSWTTAKATIQAAIDAATSGESVRIAAGVYTENINLAKAVNLFAETPFSVTIDGHASGHCIAVGNDAAGVIIDGLVLTHGVPTNSGNTYGGGIDCGASAVIRNCIFRDNGNSGQYFGGGLEISGSVKTATVQVYNCLFIGNTVRCSGGGILCEGYADFNRCTIYGNTCTSWNKIGGLAVASGGRATLKNCIVWGNNDAELGSYSGGSSGTYTASYSCIEGGCSGIGNISENPLLTDLEGYVVIAANSPCKNAGDASEFNRDGSRVDMGFSVYNVTSVGNPITINFYSNPEDGEMTQRSYFTGMAYASFPTPVRTGYSLIGWFTEATGGEQIVASRTVDPSITTLYAHWVSYADGQRAALDLGSDGTLGDDGSLIWTVDSTTSHHGGSALKSAAITHSQSTWQTLAVNGSGTLSFWWKVSSEGNYDWLRYYVDGVQGGQISGSTDWSQVTVNLEGDGEHVIKWEYAKDNIVNSGNDCGWVDQVEWSGQGTALHSVTFDMNGGGEAVVRDCGHGASVGELPTAVRAGYVFAGWFTARDGGVQVGSGYVVDSNKILYAHWIPEGEVVIVSTKVREDDPSVLDVVYRVNSTNATANVRALAFEDGEESFAKVIRPETFIDGTETNLGYAVAANVDLTLSWRVTDDWNVRLARVKIMILVEENFYPLSLDLVTIPANGSNRAVRFSTNEIGEEAFRDALFWLYASHDDGLALENGVLSAGGATLANGAEIVHPEAERYVFKSMDYQLLEGANLQYVNETARLNLNPQGGRQYVFKQN